MVKLSVEVHSRAWNVKAADVAEAEQPCRKGIAGSVGAQFSGWPEHSTLYQRETWKGQFQGITKAAQNTVGSFFICSRSFLI